MRLPKVSPNPNKITFSSGMTRDELTALLNRKTNYNKFGIDFGNWTLTENSVSGNFEFKNDGNSKVEFTSTGRVGIGVTSPSEELHVHATSGSSSALFTTPATGTSVTDGLFIGMQDSTLKGFVWNYEAGELGLATNNVERVTITSAGLVGIGTTSPQEELHIHAATDPDAIALFTTANTGTTASDGLYVGVTNSNSKAWFWNYENADVGFGSNNTERATLKATGELGLGTTSPDGLFHVHVSSAGAVTANSTADDLIVESDANTGLSILSPDASLSSIYFGSPSSNAGAFISWSHTTKALTVGGLISTSRLDLSAGGSVVARGAAAAQSISAGAFSANILAVRDGVTSPSTVAGTAQIYVDSSDGDLKVKFGNGTVTTIATD